MVLAEQIDAKASDVSVHCLLKVENSAVELSGHVDVVHDDIHLRYLAAAQIRSMFLPEVHR